MRFSVSNLACLAILSAFSTQILANPIGSVESQENDLSRRGIPKIPKIPKDPIDVPPVPGRVPGSTNTGPLTEDGLSLGRSEGKTPAELEPAGQKVVTNIDDAIKNKVPPKTGGADIFAQDGKYITEPSTKKVDESDYPKPLLNPDGAAPIKFADQYKLTYTHYVVKNKDPPGGGDAGKILMTDINKDAGIMHTPWRFGDEDQLAKIDKAYMSDMMYQCWKQAPGSKGVGNLKVQTADKIANDETIDILLEAYPKAKIDMKDGATASWKPGSPEYNQLMGSDNGRPLGRMLADYHTELGDLKVIEIRSVWYENKLPYLAFYLGK